MAFRVKGSSSAPAASPRVAQIPQTSMVGKQPSALPVVGNAPKPTRSRRDYGKTAPAAGSAPQPSPFGPSIPGGM
jgi:hypothetical protein